METKADRRVWDKAKEVLETGNRFFLTTASPDGDAVGSMLALGLALSSRKKSVFLFSPENVPDNLSFLPGLHRIAYELPVRSSSKGSFDALVVVDTGSSKLLFHGNRNAWKKISTVILNVDHHPDNDRFGNVNLVFPQAASTGEIVFDLLSRLKWELTGEAATCLLTAVMADTGAFRYPNVTPETFRIAAELLSRGASNGVIARKLYSSYSIPYAKLLGRLLENLQVDLGGKLVWSVLSREDFKVCNAPDDTADKMVEHLDMLQDAKVYALFREMEGGRIKVSFRSRDHFPVNRVAHTFGGGGHLQAAGCQLQGSLKEAEEKVVGSLRLLFSIS